MKTERTNSLTHIVPFDLFHIRAEVTQCDNRLIEDFLFRNYGPMQ
jgi:hypothetical protein